MAGKLVAVEGPDHAVVGEQVAQLARWLGERGLAVEQASLPTRGPIGMLLRLEGQTRLRFDPACLALLWMADRMDLLGRKEGIRTWLGQGRVVLCANYMLRDHVLLMDAVALDWLRRINARCTAPDLTLYLAGPQPCGDLAARYARAMDAGAGDEQNVVCVGPSEDVTAACRERVGALLWPGEGA